MVCLNHYKDDIIYILTKDIAKTRYYNMLIQNKETVITKLINRCHNVSSMADTFSVEKLRYYIKNEYLCTPTVETG